MGASGSLFLNVGGTGVLQQLINCTFVLCTFLNISQLKCILVVIMVVVLISNRMNGALPNPCNLPGSLHPVSLGLFQPLLLVQSLATLGCDPWCPSLAHPPEQEPASRLDSSKGSQQKPAQALALGRPPGNLCCHVPGTRDLQTPAD